MSTNVYEDLPAPTDAKADTFPRNQASVNIIPPLEYPTEVHAGATADTVFGERETPLTASVLWAALVSNGQYATGAKNVLDGVGVVVCVLYGETENEGETEGVLPAVLETWLFDTLAVEL